MIDTSFRFWVNQDYTQAVVIFFEEDNKSKIYSVNLQKVRKNNPDSSIDQVIYKTVMNLMNSNSES